MAEKPEPDHSPREYQVELLESAKKRNIIVCLGTGTGKTFISIKLIEYLARKDDIRRPFSEGAKRTFFLVNSVPLVFQQAAAIEKHTSLKVQAFCGEMGVDFWSKQDWLQHFEENHVLVMTAQIYFDLLQHKKLDLHQANLLVVDECHHANKKHPFKRVMEKFEEPRVPKTDHPRILGLTASVVGQKVKPSQIPSKIKQLESTMRSVCETASDPNVVEKYGAKPREVFKLYSSSQHSDPIAVYLEKQMRSVLTSLGKFLHDVKIVKDVNGSDDVIGKQIDVAKSAIRECLTALDEIGVWAAHEVSRLLIGDLEKTRKRVAGGLSNKVTRACLFLDATITNLREVCGIYDEFQLANQCEDEVQEYLKPKVKKLLELFQNSDHAKICSIIFVERRYAACVLSKLINHMAKLDWHYAHLSSDFVTGHGADQKGISDTEMKFNEQNEKLKGFRNGKFNVLVGTSVVEEGVDVPRCNLVVMFDFPKNYRAYVQSRGRGRAADAVYVLLVQESLKLEKKQEQEMYQGIDDYLSKLCNRRNLPTDEESSQAFSDDPLPPYYTRIGAKVDMGSSVSLIYRYCSKLPCDRFTTLKPRFTVNDIGGLYQCTLQLPRNCPIIGLIEGEAMESKDDAKKAVALKACEELHKMNELNDNLLPISSELSSDSEPEDVDETDGSKAKTGTKKRQRVHKVKMSKQLTEKLVFNANNVYVYLIHMKIKEVFKSSKSQTIKEIWDRKSRQFGLITNSELPPLPSFLVHHDLGKVSIDVKLRLTPNNVKPCEVKLIDWFHNFIFNDTLLFKGSLTGDGCRVVLLSVTEPEAEPSLSKRPYSPEGIAIAYDEMNQIKDDVLERTDKVSALTDLEDSIVVANYRENKGNNLVSSIDYSLSPCSPFPDLLKARTYKSYFEKKYNCVIKDDSQPLLKVVPFSQRIECLSRKNKTSASTRHEGEHLVPEMCTVRKCPQSVALRACLLPAILYRLQGFLGVSELRDTICLETRIGEVLKHSRNGLSFKRFKLNVSSDQEDTSSNSSSSDDDITDAPVKFLASIRKYLRPVDNSRPVPLRELLKALTCASSADAFDLERLEMLGDSFLKMAVSIYVYWHENHKDEGKLTKHRSKQISNKNLFHLAVNKEIPMYVKHARFTRETWSPPGNAGAGEQEIPDKSIADSLEALIGAYLTSCEYKTTLTFMSWLGLKVLHKKNCSRESHYANYPRPSFNIPDGEDVARYQDVLEKQTKEMKTFERKIGYTFKNKVLLLEAFTHPTFDDQTITGSYQRLEFLGDAILDFLVTQYIYNDCGEELTPGKLTDLRSALVNNNIFAMIAVEYDYHKYLKSYSPELFSSIGAFVTACEDYQAECPDQVNPDPYIIAVPCEETGSECIEAPKPLGDIFESIAGAIFLDSGLDIVKVWEVYYKMLQKYIDAYSKNVPLNPLRAVSEFDNELKFGHAKINENGRSVTCDLTFSEEKAGKIGQRKFTGTGRNKHNAKLSAAHKAVKLINLIGLT